MLSLVKLGGTSDIHLCLSMMNYMQKKLKQQNHMGQYLVSIYFVPGSTFNLCIYIYMYILPFYPHNNYMHRQDQLHNLWSLVQNEKTSSLFQKQEKSFFPFRSLSLSH